MKRNNSSYITERTESQKFKFFNASNLKYETFEHF